MASRGVILAQSRSAGGYWVGVVLRGIDLRVRARALGVGIAGIAMRGQTPLLSSRNRVRVAPQGVMLAGVAMCRDHGVMRLAVPQGSTVHHARDPCG